MDEKLNKPLLFFAFLLSNLTLFILSCTEKQDLEVVGAGAPLFSVKGRVADIDNDKPLFGATVEIVALGLTDTVDEKGEYRLADLKAGNRRLTITHAGYQKTEVIVELVDFDNRDVIKDIVANKAVEIMLNDELPFENPSGIWWEASRLFVTSYDSTGGVIYELDEGLNVLNRSSHIGTLLTDGCVVAIDTCFWRADSCNRSIDPADPFTPDSTTLDSVFTSCAQQIFGLARIGQYLYTTDAHGHYQTANGSFIPLTPLHVFRIDAQSLEFAGVDTLPDALVNEFNPYISDITSEQNFLRLLNKTTGDLFKYHSENYSRQANNVIRLSFPVGVAWDGSYFWVSTPTMLYQLNVDMNVRNRYAVSGFLLNQIAWDGENMWSVSANAGRIFKLAIPFEDHAP